MTVLHGKPLLRAARAALTPTPEPDQVSVDVHVKEDMYLPPLDFGVIATEERIDMPPHLTAKVTGRSSHMRSGVFMPGGWLDPGFVDSEEQPFVLEFFNMSREPFELKAGDAGARLVFHELRGPADVYDGQWKR